MRRRWGWRGLKFLVLIAAAVGAFGGAVMLLWNALMPEIFGWHEIGFVQALGLLVLARILFGRFGGRWGGHHNSWRARMIERYAQMTPEEREKFNAGFGGRCGWGRHHATPPTEAPAKV